MKKRLKECDLCGSPVRKLNATEMDVEKKPRKICDICYTTHAGNYLHYPHYSGTDVQKMARLLCNIGNMILNRMEDK